MYHFIHKDVALQLSSEYYQRILLIQSGMTSPTNIQAINEQYNTQDMITQCISSCSETWSMFKCVAYRPLSELCKAYFIRLSIVIHLPQLLRLMRWRSCVWWCAQVYVLCSVRQLICISWISGVNKHPEWLKSYHESSTNSSSHAWRSCVLCYAREPNRASIDNSVSGERE